VYETNTKEVPSFIVCKPEYSPKSAGASGIHKEGDSDNRAIAAKQDKIAVIAEEFNRLIDEQRYDEAQVTAKKAVELFPNEAATQQMNTQSKYIYRWKDNEEQKSLKEKEFLNELNNTDGSSIPSNSRQAVVYPDAKEWGRLSMGRKSNNSLPSASKTDAISEASKNSTNATAPFYAQNSPAMPGAQSEERASGNTTATLQGQLSPTPGDKLENRLGLSPLENSSPKPAEVPPASFGSLLVDILPQDGKQSQSSYLERLNSAKTAQSDKWLDNFLEEGRETIMPNAEQYDPIRENAFVPVAKEPLSTFSIDVDTASYANLRRFLRSGQMPPRDAVRIEEMVNYFSYDYSPPTDGTPFSVNMETAQCPWKTGHRLLRIGLKGREIDRKNRGASNIVFLLDVSGSMNEENKLPLVKAAMKMLVEELNEDDRVAIVTYASDTKVALPSARGNDRAQIDAAIDALQAGGCTYGSGGIQLAYQQAVDHFVPGGINRVILCTDGDLNVGVTRDEDLVELIQEKAKTGVFLTVLGFGQGNLKDGKMQKLADKGNGIYAYIDGLREAHRMLVEQMTGSLATIAKDVKIQIEFNPAAVQAYRLIGYEKRLMANQDFNDDRKDAGEIGAGHAVTALYELVPAGSSDGDAIADADGDTNQVDALRYQRVPQEKLTPAADSGELLRLSIRYKEPEQNTSRRLEFVTKDAGKKFSEATADFRFAASVASFGMMLRHSPYRGESNYAAVAEYAAGTTEHDSNGYRAEFLDMVREAGKLAAGSPQ
jgi:Ca-activated chloride channel family protein